MSEVPLVNRGAVSLPDRVEPALDASSRVAPLGPRLVIAGTHSGVGKTTIATGLMAAFARRGLTVNGAKVGPDFIDPSYHALATGRPSHSLDAVLSGEELIGPLAARASAGGDLLVVEGVMGLFDGSSVPGVDGSTASIARLLGAPVLLVVDASAMSGSVAALVHGFTSLDPRLRLAGVILNQVGSDAHAQLLREALAPLEVPVVGVVFRDDALVWRDRHLGLVPVAEQPDQVRASLARLAEVIEHSLDLEFVEHLARASETRQFAALPRARVAGRCRIALCAGPAFSFVYPENVALFRDAGAEIVPFNPLVDARLPDDCDALYAGGGFPEVYAEALSKNHSLNDDVRRRVGEGMVTWAECGGYLWLADALDDSPMVGALEGVRARMTEQLSLGYRQAVTNVDSFLGPAGLALRGHEYHYSVVEPRGDAMTLSSRFATASAGYASSTLFASYLHQHLSATPELAERFVAAATPRP